MSAFAGPFALATVLLAVAGVAKAARPAATAGALVALGLPHHQWLVRTGGAAEALLAAVALATGEPVLAALVALSYVAFAAFVVVARWRGTPLSSCGCLGTIDTPPHPLHVALDLLAAAAAAGFALQGGAGIGVVLADQPGHGIPFVLLVVVGVGACGLVMSLLPRTLSVARGARP